jgi:hypothetical protein
MSAPDHKPPSRKEGRLFARNEPIEHLTPRWGNPDGSRQIATKASHAATALRPPRLNAPASIFSLAPMYFVPEPSEAYSEHVCHTEQQQTPSGLAVRMSKALNPSEALIFRITHRDNLRWILTNGLYCSSAAHRHPSFVAIGNPDLIDKRSRRTSGLAVTGPRHRGRHPGRGLGVDEELQAQAG